MEFTKHVKSFVISNIETDPITFCMYAAYRSKLALDDLQTRNNILQRRNEKLNEELASLKAQLEKTKSPRNDISLFRRPLLINATAHQGSPDGDEHKMASFTLNTSPIMTSTARQPSAIGETPCPNVSVIKSPADTKHISQQRSSVQYCDQPLFNINDIKGTIMESPDIIEATPRLLDVQLPKRPKLIMDSPPLFSSSMLTGRYLSKKSFAHDATIQSNESQPDTVQPIEPRSKQNDAMEPAGAAIASSPSLLDQPISRLLIARDCERPSTSTKPSFLEQRKSDKPTGRATSPSILCQNDGVLWSCPSTSTKSSIQSQRNLDIKLTERPTSPVILGHHDGVLGPKTSTLYNKENSEGDDKAITSKKHRRKQTDSAVVIPVRRNKEKLGECEDAPVYIDGTGPDVPVVARVGSDPVEGSLSSEDSSLRKSQSSPTIFKIKEGPSPPKKQKKFSKKLIQSTLNKEGLFSQTISPVWRSGKRPSTTEPHRRPSQSSSKAHNRSILDFQATLDKTAYVTLIEEIEDEPAGPSHSHSQQVAHDSKLSSSDEDDFDESGSARKIAPAPKCLDMSYDIPIDQRPPTSGVGNYKYKEVVRKRAERQKLDAAECEQCKLYYEAQGLSSDARAERLHICGRHRALPKATSDDYWDLDFPSTPECVEKGYANRTVYGNILEKTIKQKLPPPSETEFIGKK